MGKSLEPPDLIQQQVVEPASAILGIVNERAISMNADHRSMGDSRLMSQRSTVL